MSYKRLSLLAVTLAVLSFLAGCGGSSSSPVVSVKASASTVDGADVITLTATVSNDKGTGGVAWSVSGGGTLSNTTTASATLTAPAATNSAQTVTVTATSVADTTKLGSVTITIAAKPAITPPSGTQLTGSVGAAYSLQLAGTGGIAPYTWTLTGGTLPTGWNLTTGGLLSGPAPVAGQAGTIDLTFTVTDSGTPTALAATLQLTVTIAPAPAITFTGTVPATATSGSTYAGSAAASGGAGALTYSLLSGALPSGLSISASTGAITGAPTGVGPSNFTIKAVDNFGDTPATQGYSIAVSPGAATHFAVSAPATATAGTAVSIAVTALDTNENIATGYSGIVHFTSADGTATLPANSGLSSGQGSFQATLKTAGNQTITATDSVTSSISGTASAITVSSAAATHLTVSAPTSAAAGSSLNVSVMAEDAYNNTATSYSGTVHLTSTDASAVLPADATLSSGTKTFSIILKTAASQTVSATDAGSSSITGITGAIAVSPAPATSLVVTSPATATAGATLSIGVTAMDAYSNIAKGYSGTIHFTSTDGTATLPGNTTLTNGQGTFSATLKTAGSGAVTATDAATSSITGTTSAIVVSPASASHFATAAPATATAGSLFNVTVTAEDAYGNVVTSYSGTVHFASTDTSADLPPNSSLTNGQGSFSATLKTAASQTITAIDTVTASIAGTTSAIVVSPAAANLLSLTIPATTTAGTSVNIGIKAMDVYGNVATGFTGTVHFSTSDPSATLPADTTLTNGQGSLPATMKTAGTQTIAATASGVTSGNGTIAVNSGTATHFAMTAPATAIAGSQMSVTVTARDAFSNMATSYSGTIHFTSTDGSATLPANSGLTSGQGSFQVTLGTVGNQVVLATDIANSTIQGGTPSIAVSPGAAAHLTVWYSSSNPTAGTSYNLGVTATDNYGNTATGYTGTVHFTSTDAAAALPVNAALTNGQGSFPATMKTAGNQCITATDTVTSSIIGTTSTFQVSPGAAAHLTVWYSSSNPTAGTSYNVGITAYDSFGNTATGYTGTVHFTSTDAAAALPANTALSSGQGSFPATMKTVGNQSITATDTINSSIFGTTSQLQVSPGATARLVFTATPTSPATVGVVVVTVMPTDACGNMTPGYTGIVHVTSSDPAAVLPPDSVVGAMHSFQVTLETAGSQTITATDTVNQSITGTTSSITVVAGPATHFLVTAPATAATGMAFNVTVAAKDTYNNTVNNGFYPYSGTVHFTSTDGSATLPADSTLTNGQGSFSATLNTIGSQTITATDTVTSSINGTSPAITVSSISINPASTILTPAYTGTAYSQTFTASGGTAPYTWSVTVNGVAVTDLGLNLNSSTGVLSGNVPSGATPGPINFTVGVTDHNNATASKQFTVNVYNPLTFTTNTLNGAIYNSNYSAVIVATGGSGSYTWAVNGASIPSGADMAIPGGGGLTGADNGGNALTIGGVPNTYGDISLAVQVTDPVTGLNKIQTFTVNVNSLTVSVDPDGIPQGMVNMPYTFGNVNIQNGSGPYTVTYTNAPAGLAGDSTNHLVGTPTSSGTTTVTVKVTDSSTPAHQVGTTTFSLLVVPETVGTDNGKLKGQYACYMDLYWASGVKGGDNTSTLYRGGMVFAFTADGSGTVTGGEMDQNSPYSGYHYVSSFTGAYAIGSDNRGYINFGSGQLIVSVAGANFSGNVFQELALTPMDDAGSSPEQSGGGHCYKQVTSSLNGIRPSGGYVYGMHGESPQGNSEVAAGQAVFSGSTATVVQDMVTGAGTPNSYTSSFTTTTTDPYGRMVMQISGVNESVQYLTNDAKGDSFMMTMSGHNGLNSFDFMIGQERAQSSTNIAVSYPINGNAVMYLSGPVNTSGSSPTYKAMAVQLTGSSSAKQITINSIANNNGSTFSLDTDPVYGQTISYTTDANTGRTIMSGTNGDFFYLYDTNAAVVLFADTGNGGGRQNLIGWLEPQTTSGSWSVSDVAASAMMFNEPNGDYNSDREDSVLTVASDGTLSNLAQDISGWNWASWDEGVNGGDLAVTATGAMVPNSTDGANYGLFDMNMTAGGSTSTQAECYAISVDAAVKSTTKGKMVCIDTSNDKMSLSIVQE